MNANFEVVSIIPILERVCEIGGKVIYIKDYLGNYLYVSDLWLKTLHLSSEQVLNKSDIQIQDSLIQENHWEDMNLLKQKSTLTKTKFFELDPNDINLQIVKEPVLDSNSEVVGLVCFFNFEKNKLVSQKVISFLEENSEFGIWVLELSTFEFTFSLGLINILEIEKDSNLTFERYLEFTHPGEKLIYERNIAEAIQGKKNFFLEKKIITGSKQEKYLVEKINFYNIEGEEIIYALVFNITDTYLQKQTLHEEKQKQESIIQKQSRELIELIQTKNKLLLKYQAFLRSMGEITYERDLFTNDIKWSGETEKILGIPLRNMPSNWNEYSKLIYPEDLKVVEDEMKSFSSHKISYSLEYRIYANGQYKWILDKGYKMHDNESELELIGIIRDIHELKVSTERMKELAFKDELTGVYNRRGIFQLLEQNFFQAQRYGLNLELYYCDLNDFKKINDTYGHDVGDNALIDFTNILRSTLRKSDVLGRVGGDEFIFFAISNPTRKRNSLEERLKKAVDEFNQKMNRPYKLSFSIGRVQYDSILHVTPDDLITEADFMMYQNKKLIKGL